MCLGGHGRQDCRFEEGVRRALKPLPYKSFSRMTSLMHFGGRNCCCLYKTRLSLAVKDG